MDTFKTNGGDLKITFVGHGTLMFEFAGKIIHVYGASTKGNTMLQYFGIDHTLIEAAAERDSRKFGTKTIATEIPIISEEESRKRADYFLVLPWHFLHAFLAREKEFLASGGKFIVPFPEFRIIGSEASEV